jgi:hypothetical protein
MHPPDEEEKMDLGLRDARAVRDAAVVVIQSVATGLVFGLNEPFRRSDAGTLLMSMEIITIAFHAVYVVLLLRGSELVPSNGPNPLKWLEVRLRIAPDGVCADALTAAVRCECDCWGFCCGVCDWGCASFRVDSGTSCRGRDCAAEFWVSS